MRWPPRRGGRAVPHQKKPWHNSRRCVKTGASASSWAYFTQSPTSPHQSKSHPKSEEAPAEPFYRVPKERGTFFVDREGCVFIYRTFRPHWLPGLSQELSGAIQELLGETLKDPAMERLHRSGLRGLHYPCIIGHCRQYQRVSSGAQGPCNGSLT